MAPWTPSQRGSQSASSRHGLDPVTQLHNNALQTPTTLAGQMNANKSRYADSSSSDDNAHAIDDEDDFAAANTSTARASRHSHSRSMNIPLPSIFSGKKKRQGSSGGHPPHLAPANRNASQPWPLQGGHHKRRSDSGSQDFATGTCMTCASLMRWPRGLKVFKCTICTTVNDLEPLRKGDTGMVTGNARKGERSNGHQYKGGMAVSIDHTKALIHQCLKEHIRRKWSSSDVRLNKGLELADRTIGKNPSDTRRPAGTGYQSINPGPCKDWTGADSEVPIYVSRYEFDEEPTLQRPHPPKEERYGRDRPSREPPTISRVQQPRMPLERPKHIFKALEEYICACFTSFERINVSFPAQSSNLNDAKESVENRQPRERLIGQESSHQRHEGGLHNPSKSCDAAETGWEPHDLDPKLLLLGGFAENGSWWLGSPEEEQHNIHAGAQRPKKTSLVSSRSPQIHWKALSEWYSLVISPARDWFQVYEQLSPEISTKGLTERDLQRVEGEFLIAQEHVQKTLLKSIETLMKRPGRPLVSPADVRFLMIILENPLLHSNPTCFQGLIQPTRDEAFTSGNGAPIPSSGLLSGQHSGIIKRIFGLISNSSSECHNFVISWLGRYQHERFVQAKELATRFLTYRMLRQGEKKRDKEVDITAGLIPQMQAGRSGAYLHDEIGSSSKSKKPKEAPKTASYTDDWQIKATARFLSLAFAANNMPVSKRIAEETGIVSPNRPNRRLPISDFYNSLVDNIDLISDFEAWESKRGRFNFCQYPFLLSIWAKTKVLEYDARRQMQNKARDAFFDTIMTSKNVNPFLVLDVRRDCLVEDSLTAVSEAIGSGGEDIKKGLRIMFKGEEGIDAGGLRKEWFLLLVREVFNPDHGMFTYDEDSQYCYFNPNSFETSDQFFLVGVVMGLAIYNSTILDVALPPFVFRKLLALAPAVAVGTASAHPRPKMRYTLDDLAEFRPRLAHGLRALLEFDGDVQDTFALDFVIPVERYGTQSQIPLCPGGHNKPVTNNNCREYVDLYVRYLLDTSVSRQFEPFKRGFYTVCGGNAFSLLGPEEIDMLVRGSDEPLDIPSLRAVAEYHNWTSKIPDGSEPAVTWFWETFEAANPGDQRRLLSFITGSDRVPATGATTLPINVSCLGDDSSRFPVARTCFNQICLWRYLSKQKLEYMLWTAVHESEGFGLK